MIQFHKYLKYSTDIKNIENIDNKEVHNFSLGCLDAYFHLDDTIQNQKSILLNNNILIINGIKPKAFVFCKKVEDKEILN